MKMIIEIKNMFRTIICGIILIACATSLLSCGASRTELVDIYVTDRDKQLWYDALVKLISNQEVPYGEHGEIMGYQAPRPDEPSIADGLDMGLFDITNDGIPELLLNLGGGSAGNDYFYCYNIFSGEMICQLDGGGEHAWNVYYDIENDRYLPIGRYDWSSGDSGSMHYITTVDCNKDTRTCSETCLFYAEYEHNQVYTEDGNGNFASCDLEIESVLFKVNDELVNFQCYHYAMTDFYQNHSLVPHTGLELFYWSDVADPEDDAIKRAEKMAGMLLFGSGQQFVKGK